MRVRLRGIHKVSKRLADGSRADYFYAWRGGPRLEGKPGSVEFIASFNAAVADRKSPPQGVLFTLIAEWRASADYQNLAASTRASYAFYAKLIEAEFGDMPLVALDDIAVRAVFKDWRDGFAATPRKADLAWTVLARILSVAVDRGRIARNPCEKGGRLYKADRKRKIWREGDIGRLLSVASPEIRLAFLMALHTGQREGDLLRLSWNALDGNRLTLRQSKGGAPVAIPLLPDLVDELTNAPRCATTILVSSRGLPWTPDGFKTSWGRAFAKSGIENDLHFHDLRGTAITRLALAGCRVPEIAAVTGHALNTVQEMLDRHYLGGKAELAEIAMRKLERRTKTVNRL